MFVGLCYYEPEYYIMYLYISFSFAYENCKMTWGDISMSKEGAKYDFRAMGQAIKKARLNRGWTREQLAQEVDLAPRYIMSLENKGQHPSFQVFITLITLFNIYFFFIFGICVNNV